MIDNNEAERYIIVVTTILTIQQECRGRSPLTGFGAAHPGDAEARPEKLLFNYSAGVQRTKSFDGVRGVPEKLLFAAVGGMKEVTE